jgi:hypothetical protein
MSAFKWKGDAILCDRQLKRIKYKGAELKVTMLLIVVHYPNPPQIRGQFPDKTDEKRSSLNWLILLPSCYYNPPP